MCALLWCGGRRTSGSSGHRYGGMALAEWGGQQPRRLRRAPQPHRWAVKRRR